MIYAKISTNNLTPEMKDVCKAIYAHGTEALVVIPSWQAYDAFFKAVSTPLNCRKGEGPTDPERVYLARMRQGKAFDPDTDMPHSGILGFQKKAYCARIEEICGA